MKKGPPLRRAHWGILRLRAGEASQADAAGQFLRPVQLIERSEVVYAADVIVPMPAAAEQDSGERTSKNPVVMRGFELVSKVSV